MNLIIWMNIPSHHQSQFFDTLNRKIDVFKVNYYSQVTSERSAMGWADNIQLKPYEQYINPSDYQIDLNEMKNYIHILPGYGHPFLIQLRGIFSNNDIPWIHWSERATPGWKWYISYYRKAKHAKMVNNYALGAFAIGQKAKHDFMAWGVKKSKIGILPYSFNHLNMTITDELIEEYKQGRKAFLYVGSLYDGKGIDLLLKAFASEFSNTNDWCLILVGNEKPNYDYKTLVNDLKIKDKVLFRGVIESNKISSAYLSSDVFILPSRYDGWGMVVNEALYCDLPVIVSGAVGASDHLVLNNVNGFVFESESIEQLAKAMSQYKDDSTIKQHSSQAKAVFEKYNSETMANYLINTIRQWQKNEDIT